ncbi:MAG TPA: hypothetical protein VFL86_12305 [Burkholderiaceae bacterium]|nr:hypothetical protein [Burkholderiaceae bacterium]
MRTSTSTRPHESPDLGGNGPAGRQRRSDRIDGMDAAMTGMQPTPQALAANTLMDGAAGQVGNLPQTDYTMNGPDEPEDEESED